MSSDVQNVEALIRSLGGCGRFQVLMAFPAFCVRMAGTMSMVMMAFGNYNPGWRCLDNSTEADVSDINITMVFPPNDTNTKDRCQVHDTCNDVQFVPGISTAVSEWNLVCRRSWIPPLVISIQMVGVFVGAYLTGYLGDKFGRKRVTCLVTLYHSLMNAITIFSNSWQMFAAFRFLIGAAVAPMVVTPVVLLLEFVPPKWRNAVNCCPTWPLGCILFTLSAMATNDWRYLHAINAVLSAVSLLPLYWVPESLRWSLINDKTADASATIRGIAKMNGKKTQRTEATDWIANYVQGQSSRQTYSCFYLLKRGLRYPTFVVGFFCLSANLIYYAIAFGMKAMPGSLYTNLLILFSTDLPVTVISLIIPEYLGRKLSIIIFLIMSTCGMFTIVGLDLRAADEVKAVGVLAAAVTATASLNSAWDVSRTFVGEMYPTIIRSTSISYTMWVSRSGAILAPYLIPNKEDANVINYSIMAILALLCCIFVIFLPETKGRPLKDGMENPNPSL